MFGDEKVSSGNVKKSGNFYHKKEGKVENSGRPVFRNSAKPSENRNDYRYDNRPKNTDDKDNVKKSINNFGSLVKNLNDENSRIKAPLRDYNEVDFGNNYRKVNELQKPSFINSKPLDKQEAQTTIANEDLQRPTFVNKNLENRGSNFVEIETNGDVKKYLYSLI
jgi:hypothetical protein